MSIRAGGLLRETGATKRRRLSRSDARRDRAAESDLARAYRERPQSTSGGRGHHVKPRNLGANRGADRTRAQVRSLRRRKRRHTGNDPARMPRRWRRGGLVLRASGRGRDGRRVASSTAMSSDCRVLVRVTACVAADIGAQLLVAQQRCLQGLAGLGELRERDGSARLEPWLASSYEARPTRGANRSSGATNGPSRSPPTRGRGAGGVARRSSGRSEIPPRRPHRAS